MNGRFMVDPWQLVTRMPVWRSPLRGEYPPLNVIRGDKGIVIEALFPGVDRASLEVTVVGDALTIRGQRQAEPGMAEERFHRRERPVGTFARTLSIGERLDGDTAEATYTNGILRVQVAAGAEAAPKRIAIQS